MSGMSHLLRWSMFGPVLSCKTPKEGRVSPDPDWQSHSIHRHGVLMSCGLHLKQVWCYPISMPPMHDYWMRNIHCRCIVLGNGYEKDLCRPELSVIGLLLLCMFLRRWGQQHWTWHSLQRCGQFWTTVCSCWFLLPPWKTPKHWKNLKLLPWDDLINRWYILSTVPYAAWEDIRLPQRYSLPFSWMQVEGLLVENASWEPGNDFKLDCGCNAKLNDSLSIFLLAVFKRDLWNWMQAPDESKFQALKHSSVKQKSNFLSASVARFSRAAGSKARSFGWETDRVGQWHDITDCTYPGCG